MDPKTTKQGNTDTIEKKQWNKDTIFPRMSTPYSFCRARRTKPTSTCGLSGTRQACGFAGSAMACTASVTEAVSRRADLAAACLWRLTWRC